MIRKGYADTQHGQVHYRMCGDQDNPTFVLLHQTASSSRMYESMMNLLADEFFLIAPDTPGFGQSFRPPTQPTITYYAEVILEALANVGVQQFHLFGHHTGSAIACEMAVLAPDRVRTLSLTGPTFYGDAAARQQRREQVVRPLVISPDGSHLQVVWQRVKGGQPGQPLWLSHREAVDTLQAGDRFHEAYEAVFAHDFPASFSQVKCPIWLGCGADDGMFPRYELACAARPDARTAVLPGGTYVCDTHPEAVAEELRQFIRTIEI